MTTQSIPEWVLFVNKFNVFFSQNLLGGKKFIKLALSINTHKALTPVSCNCTDAFLQKLFDGSFCLPCTARQLRSLLGI